MNIGTKSFKPSVGDIMSVRIRLTHQNAGEIENALHATVLRLAGNLTNAKSKEAQDAFTFQLIEAVESLRSVLQTL